MNQPLPRTHSASSSFAFSYYQAIVPYVLLITLLCSSTQFAWALKRGNGKDKDPNLAKALADRCIKPFPSDDEDEEERNYNSQESSQKPAYDIDLPTLDPATIRKIIFNVLAKSEEFARLQRGIEPMLNDYALDDLKLFYGTPSDPGYHLLSRINHTKTVLGEAVLASLLATPTSNLKELHHRQHIIQTLLDNPLAAEELKSILQDYQKDEQGLLAFSLPINPLYSKEYTQIMRQLFYFESNAANKSVSLLELSKRCIIDLLGIAAPFLGQIGTSYFAALKKNTILISLNQLSSLHPIDNLGFVIPIWRSIQLSWQLLSGARLAGHLASRYIITQIKKVLSIIWNFEITLAFPTYMSYRNYKVMSSILRNLALRMADVQTFIITATQISETIAASPALEKAYGKKLTNIRKLLAQAEEDTELGRLIGYLQHLPLQNWNYFLNNAGKLLASYKLFIEHKDAFVDAMYELGQLDAYLSLATLVQESQTNDSNHGYTFVKFLDREQKSTPYIKIDQMWNPFLDPKQAVGNSIEMDGAPGGVRNIILTGPNAGGKSTFLTGVVDTLLLAHVAGIGPAQAIQITPFNKINTYIDVTDDVAAAQSLFMAEVNRAKKHTEIITGLQLEEFSFTIFDEPFSGTNPKEGAAAEYSILKSLGAYPNSLSMVATHYPTVMLLEEQAPDRGFVNYKVYITRDSNGKINYTYKIVPGKSDQAIAINILEEQGFDTSMLEDAKYILANPDQYNAEFKEKTGETRDLVQYKPGDIPGTEEGEEDEEDLVEYKPEGSVATKD